MPKSGISTSPY